MEDLQDWDDINRSLKEDVTQKPWSEIINEPWCKGWQKSVENSPSIYVRAFGTVSGLPYPNVYKYFSDLRERAIGDDTIKDVELIEEDSAANTAIFRYVIKSPSFIVSDRDVIARRSVKEQWPDTLSTGIKIQSCEHSKYPPDANDKVVRATTKQGWVIKKTEEENKFDISMSIENNIGGSIPMWITNMLAGKMPRGIFERLNKRAQEYKP